MPVGQVSTLPAQPARWQPRRLLAPIVLGLLLAATLGGRAEGQPPPMTEQDKTMINVAIDRGVVYLQRSQNPSGSWGAGTNVGSGGGYAIGYTALCGLALVECGVPTTDPGLQRALRVVRLGSEKADNTYEVSFVILFLDRMGERSDRALIQRLAVRLIAGQSQTGGWSYKLPLASDQYAPQILAGLRRLNPNLNGAGPSLRDRPGSLGLCIKMSDDIRPKPSTAESEGLDPEKNRQAVVRSLGPNGRMAVFQDPNTLSSIDPEGKGQEWFNGTTDNSTTHLASIALWAARRHDVPTDRSFALLNRRFRNSQNQDGSWSYKHTDGGIAGGGTPQMTSVALLNLAIGFVLNTDPDAPARLEQDPQVLLAMKSLSRRVGEPVGSFKDRPTVKASGGLYYFWAMERIAVLYDLRTLDNKDWYRWGAEILVCHQLPDGSWDEGGYHGEHPALNTAFALLFLKRANLTPDLSRRLVVDTNTLTAKVNPTDPVPEPKVETPPPVISEPEPMAEPQPEPEPEPESPAPKTTPPPSEAPTTKVEPPSRPLWPWLLGLFAVLLGGGGVLFFVIKSARDEEEEEKPKKKKKKKKS